MNDLVTKCAAASCHRTVRRWMRTPAWPGTVGVCEAHGGELERGDASTVLIRGDGSRLAGPWTAVDASLRAGAGE